MWFVGLVLGLWIGGLANSVPAAIGLGIGGAALAHWLTRKRNAQASIDALPLPPERASGADGTEDWADIAKLKRQVAELYKRVGNLEQQLQAATVAAAATHNPGESASVLTPDSLGTAPAQASDGLAAPEAASPVFTQPPPAVATPSVLAASAVPPVFRAAVPPMDAPVPLAKASTSTVDPADTAAPMQAHNAANAAAGPAGAATSLPPSQPAATPKPPPTRTPVQAPPPPARPLRERLPAPIAALIFGGNGIVKMGVLILFLGLAFLLRYTAERVTVPIELRYAAVALMGMALLGLGWRLRERRRDYALILQGAGVGVFYLTTLAAMKVHDLLPPTMGFVVLFLVAAFGAVLAIAQNAPVLAIIAALEGFAAPVLASTGQNRPVALFTYLAVLDVGILLMAWFKAWRLLNVIAFVGTFTLASGWAQRNYTVEQYSVVQPFLILFFVLFAVMGLFFARRTLKEALHDWASEANTRPAPLGANAPAGAGLRQRAAQAIAAVGRVDSALVFGVPLTAFGLQYGLCQQWDKWPAFSALAFSAFYLVLARVVFSPQRPGLRLLAEAYAVVGVIFLTLAIPLGLEGQWTGAAWAIEGAGMYWLGQRQNRPYARALAFVVMAGAAYKLLGDTTINSASEATLLSGSFIGPVLLALSVFVMWAMQRGHVHAQGAAASDTASEPAATGSAWESALASALPWLGMGSLALLPWQTLAPVWAAPATAVLGLGGFLVAARWTLPYLGRAAATLQAVAVAGLLTNLSAGSTREGAALQNGWQGMVAAGVIALCILAMAGWSMASVRRRATANNTVPQWSLGSALALVTGVCMLHLAMLFGASFAQAALIWPLTGALTLWVALRLSHTPLAALAGGLQVAAVVLFAGVSVGLLGGRDDRGLFASLSFWTPLVLGCVGILAADWARAQWARGAANGAAPGARTGALESNPWAMQTKTQWLLLLWGLAWWLFAWGRETHQWSLGLDQHATLKSAWIAVLLVTSGLLVLASRQRAWLIAGRATAATLWGLVIVAVLFEGLGGVGARALSDRPSDAWGWAAWPAALLWHLRLLRHQTPWLAERTQVVLHVVGVWLFTALATRELVVWWSDVGDAGSVWPLMGWVLAAAGVLAGMSSRGLGQRWPVRAFAAAYLQVAALPLAAGLLAWVWVTNAHSTGNAAPLPYLPLLNPLELMQWLCVACLAIWWRAAQNASANGTLPILGERKVALATLGLTGFALITGTTLRSCHHFAGVPWDYRSLYASGIVQAALSLVWALLGVTLMVMGNRQIRRSVWVVGAALLGVVVLKLFFVELADRGGLFRIVSFLGVGVLLLLVGYFAPVPPTKPTGLPADNDANGKDAA